MGTIIDPSAIKAQSASIKQSLTSQNESLTAVLPNIENFQQAGDVNSEGFEGLKSQIGGHKSIIQGLMSANTQVMNDSDTLDGAVGNERLDEDKINAEIQRLEAQNLLKQQTVSTYAREKASISSSLVPVNPAAQAYYSTQIAGLNGEIGNNGLLIGLLNSKLEKIKQIISATESLYLTGETMYDLVSAGMQELSSSWNASSKTFSGVSGSWQGILESPERLKEEVEAEKALRKENITKEQIKNMMELGYTRTDILGQYQSLETKEDKEFYLLMMNDNPEDYLKAFNIDESHLSNSLYTILIDINARQIEFGSDAPQRMLDFLNGMYGNLDKENINAHLLRLAKQTSLMQAQSEYLQNYTKDRQSVEYLQKLGLLDTLWESMIVANPLGSNKTLTDSATEFTVAKITKLHFNTITDNNPASISFEFQKYSVYSVQGLPLTEKMIYEQYYENKNRVTVDGSHLADSSILAKEDILAQLEEIRRAKREFTKETLKQWGIFAVGMWQPWLATSLSFVNSLDGTSLLDFMKDGSKTTKEIDDFLFAKASAANKLSMSKEDYSKWLEEFNLNKEQRQSMLDSIAKGTGLLNTFLGPASKMQSLTNEELKLKAKALAILFDLGGKKISFDGKTVIQVTDFDKLTYEQQQKMEEFVKNGYGGLLSGLTKPEREDIEEQLKQLSEKNDQNTNKKEKDPNFNGTIDFILNGGDPFDPTVNLDKVDDYLIATIEQSDKVKDKEGLLRKIDEYLKKKEDK